MVGSNPRSKVGWTPCECPEALAANTGHLWIRCREVSKNAKAALGQHERSGSRMGTQSEEDIMTGRAGRCEIGIDLGFQVSDLFCVGEVTAVSGVCHDRSESLDDGVQASLRTSSRYRGRSRRAARWGSSTSVRARGWARKAKKTS